MLDDGKVEELTSGRDRGAGIRVVVGETTGFAHTADLTERPARRGRGRGRRGPRRRRRHQRRWPSPGSDAPTPNDVAILPERRRQGHARSSCSRRADEAARGAGRAITPGDAPATATAAAASSSPTPTACSPRTTRSARCSSVDRAWPSGDTGMQTGYESLGRTVGFELFDRYDVEELAREAAEPGAHQAGRPARARRGTMPVVIGPGGGGVLFHEACGHGLEADLVGKGASVFAGRVGEQVASPARHARRRRHHGRASGAASPSTTRARPPSATCSSRTASSPTTCGTSCGPARRAGPARATAGARATSTCRWCA